MLKRKSKFNPMLMAGCSISVMALMTSNLNVANAQDVDTERDDSRVIEEILVTANKRQTSIQEVPLAITALTGEFTRDVNINDVKDVIVWTPGITGNSQDSFIDVVSVRGILTNDFGVGGDPSVGFFKNNLYQGRNGPVNSSLFDMERVEALRGPQGFLFGRNYYYNLQAIKIGVCSNFLIFICDHKQKNEANIRTCQQSGHNTLSA